MLLNSPSPFLLLWLNVQLLTATFQGNETLGDCSHILSNLALKSLNRKLNREGTNMKTYKLSGLWDGSSWLENSEWNTWCYLITELEYWFIKVQLLLWLEQLFRVSSRGTSHQLTDPSLPHPQTDGVRDWIWDFLQTEQALYHWAMPSHQSKQHSLRLNLVTHKNVVSKKITKQIFLKRIMKENEGK